VANYGEFGDENFNGSEVLDYLISKCLLRDKSIQLHCRNPKELHFRSSFALFCVVIEQ
jgi:hypothetical protein